jgi:hypothetical protein
MGLEFFRGWAASSHIFIGRHLLLYPCFSRSLPHEINRRDIGKQLVAGSVFPQWTHGFRGQDNGQSERHAGDERGEREPLLPALAIQKELVLRGR